MPKRTEYKVTGTTKVKPENLPDGLKVETTQVRLIEEFPLYMNRKMIVQESDTFPEGAHFTLESAGNTVKGHMDRGAVTRLRDTLNELLKVVGLRKVTDKSGYFKEWFELEPNKFYNEPSLERAKQSKEAGGSAWTYTQIEENYGVRSVEFY